MSNAQFWVTVAIGVASLVSLFLHRSHNKKLNELGDAVDSMAGKIK